MGPTESYGGYESRQNIIRPIVRPPSQRLYVYAFLLPVSFLPSILYIRFPRGRALKGVKSRHRRNIIIFDFLEIDSAGWRRRKNIALKGMESIVEDAYTYFKEEKRLRIVRRVRNYEKRGEATIEPLKNDGRWLSSGAFVAAAKGEPFNAVSAPMGWPRLA